MYHTCSQMVDHFFLRIFFGLFLLPPIFIYMRFIIGLTECRAIFGTAPHQIEKIFTFRAANEINLAPFETMKWVRKKKFAKLSKCPTSAQLPSPTQPSPCALMREFVRLFLESPIICNVKYLACHFILLKLFDVHYKYCLHFDRTVCCEEIAFVTV